ncbi:hypothetical protein CC80DRAFT_550002 [Byssothecium circinans]|uniref:Uncharacterized protein n=1 Tax=Byssothecium circinans TaxID=147558 RepID=A0A6A5TRC1_9PLEO|nr:hypothetical protein CC80DRAFT_550002 [Byssothecium circinans]
MKAALSFIADLPLYEEEKPYELWLPPEQLPKDIPVTNCQWIRQPDIEIEDLRKSNAAVALDTTGFKYLNDPLDFELQGEDLMSDTESENLVRYLNGTVDRVKKEFKADKAICFDWRYRKSQQDSKDRPFLKYIPERGHALNPASVVHADDSPDGGLARLKRHLTTEELKAFEDGKLHIRFVNFWRPLVPVVKDRPLSLCDRRSILGEDLVRCDKIRPEYVSEGLYLKYKPYHKWYWLSSQTRDEPFLFITWDSQAGETPACPPHGAVELQNAPASLPPRVSIEVRVMVLSVIG